jgi:penicillin amidase
MKRGRVLTVIAVVIVAVLVLLAAVSVWYVRRPWPQTKGDLVAEGLSSPVEVIRDEWGVPHIYAQTEHDLFFAQGYIHAQDRLWQMEFNRRLGHGTLSAALGPATLDIDRFMRTLGLRRAAQEDLTALDTETLEILQAYADGVNAFIDSNQNRLPLEFTILGVSPAPWTPVDSLVWGKVMSFSLCGNYDIELLRARMIAELGEQAAEELMPSYPDAAPVIVPAEAHNYTWLRGATLDRLNSVSANLRAPGFDQGSNNWVIHGSRTATGMPILADDTHLGLDMPSIWYENSLHGGRFDSVGFSFPGVPLVIIGHNARIAWGVTNLPADVQDFYIEKVDDRAHPTQYQFRDQWQDLEIVYETMEVKDQEPETLRILLTHHGPLMNNVLGTLPSAEPLALQWTALEGTNLIHSVVLLNLATNWTEFRQALSYWDAPSQNFIYADVEGNIGYQSPGKIPIRATGHQGMVPVPGWTGEYEWQGYIPFDELPSVLNPPAGYIATANNKVTSADYPYHLASEWSAPYRAQRITELLASDDSITITDVRNIHAQTYSLPAEALRPYLLTIQPASEQQATALDLVGSWDLYNETDRVAASIYQAWYWYLIQNTLGDEFGEDLLQDYMDAYSLHVPMMIDLMGEPENPWFDDITTSQVETRDVIAQRSLADALAWLNEHDGDAPENWEWGQLHTKTFIHRPLGQSGIGLLESLFNSKAIPARGDNFTVDAAGFSFNQPFEMGAGVSQRYIADLSELDNSRTIHTTGQSGHLFHRHREDFIPLWQNVEYHPMPFSRSAVESSADTTLVLTPP